MTYQQSFKVETPGRGLQNITAQVAEVVTASKISVGLCHVFLHHTSASLIICENSDPKVLHDLDMFMGRFVIDGDKIFSHIDEGPDDMSAHVRTILTQSSLTIPVTQSQLDLGTWQGIFVWEHRLKSYSRKVTVTVQG